MRTGVAIALLSALLFGASTPLAKLVLGHVDPWMLAALLYLGAGLGLALVLFFRRAFGLPSAEARLHRADLPWLALIILAGGIAGPLFLMSGLSRTDAATASLLLNLEGLATMAIAWVIFRENVDRRLLSGAAAILAGAILLSWQGRASLDLGAGLIACACLCWGIDNNLTRRVSHADPLQIAMLKGLVAGIVNLLLARATGASLPSIDIVFWAGLIGFLGYGLSIALFVLALRHLGTARTGAYFSLAPFVGAALAILVLGETVTLSFGLAAALMAIGLWLHLAERHAHDHSHEPLAHDHAHDHDDHHQHDHPAGEIVNGPHSHLHAHGPLTHRHQHYPDLHHRHGHSHSN